MDDENNTFLQMEPVTLDVDKLHSADPRLVDTLTIRLRVLEHFTFEDVRDLLPAGMCERDAKLAIHGAEMRLLAEGVVFAPKNGRKERITKAKQAIGRAKRGATAGMKKLARAVLQVSAAAPLTDDPLEREQIARIEMKRANQLALAKGQLRTAAKPKPPGI